MSDNPPMATDPAYQRIVMEYEQARQDYLNTKVVLTDLITDIRNRHYKDREMCASCQGDLWPCSTFYAIDRAEARLKEMTDE